MEFYNTNTTNQSKQNTIKEILENLSTFDIKEVEKLQDIILTNQGRDTAYYIEKIEGDKIFWKMDCRLDNIANKNVRPHIRLRNNLIASQQGFSYDYWAIVRHRLLDEKDPYYLVTHSSLKF